MAPEVGLAQFDSARPSLESVRKSPKFQLFTHRPACIIATHLKGIHTPLISMSSLADVLKISILGNESIHAGFHLLPYIFDTILSTLPSSTYALVTDTNLAQLYLPDVKAAFDKAAKDHGSSARFLIYEVAPGEGAKSRKVKGEIEDWLLDHSCTRDTVVLAFGGGVIGDLTGFVAATL